MNWVWLIFSTQHAADFIGHAANLVVEVEIDLWGVFLFIWILFVCVCCGITERKETHFE